MANAIENSVQSYIQAAHEPDAAKRRALIEACFAEDGRLVSRSREFRGREAVLQMFQRFFADPEVLGVRMLSAVDATGSTFRFRSAVEYRNGDSVEFFDAGEVDESGCIRLILTFAGPLAEAPQHALRQ